MCICIEYTIYPLINNIYIYTYKNSYQYTTIYAKIYQYIYIYKCHARSKTFVQKKISEFQDLIQGVPFGAQVHLTHQLEIESSNQQLRGLNRALSILTGKSQGYYSRCPGEASDNNAASVPLMALSVAPCLASARRTMN